MQYQSGIFMTQPSGYKAFIPNDLPLLRDLQFSEKLNELLFEAEKELLQLDIIGEFLPHVDLFVTMAIRKEAVLSSQIEGTQATLTDVLTYETWNQINNFDDVHEVVNYIKALNESLEMLKKLPLCLRVIKHAHYLLMQGERGKDKEPGEFRRSQNWIGGLSLKQAIFVPPPHDVAILAMGQLEKFMNDHSELPLLIQCGLIHYQFETIHPFLDGNGRIGRLIIDLFLSSKGLLKKPILYSSLYFKIHRQEYFDSLMRVRTNSDYEQWLEFFISAILWSAKTAIFKIRSVLELQERLKKVLMNDPRASLRSLQLLDFLFQKPLVTISSIQESLQMTFQGASDQVKLFIELSLLEEFTGQKRSRRYAFEPYLKIIED